jgi:Uma2 family endonuclease
MMNDAERDLQRRPDVAYVAYDHWPESTVPRDIVWNVVPDLAIEVVTPSYGVVVHFGFFWDRNRT